MLIGELLIIGEMLMEMERVGIGIGEYFPSPGGFSCLGYFKNQR